MRNVIKEFTPKKRTFMGLQFNKFIERDWQQEAREKLSEVLMSSNENRHFLLNACPGSGKSLWAGNISRMMKNGEIETEPSIGKIDYTIVVVPSIAIKSDFAESINRILRLNFKTSQCPTSSRDRQLLGDIPRGDGWIFTYQAVANGVIGEVVRIWRERGRKILVIFDEVHHLSEENSWGEQAELLYNNSTFCLTMTGTPFRGDKRKIKCVSYDENEVCIPDFNYNVWNGIQDNVTRMISYHQVSGTFRLRVGEDGVWNEMHMNSIRKPDDLSGIKEHVFDPTSNLLTEMIERTDSELDKIEKGEQRPYAPAGLYLCLNIPHAHEVASRIEALTGHQPLLVSNADENSHENIRRFKSSSKRYIVSIAMVTEGVDIPRVRTVSWACTTKSFMKFCQSVGRSVRVVDRSYPEISHVFYHSFPWMTEHAENYENSQVPPADHEKKEIETEREYRERPPIDFEDEYESTDYFFNGEYFSENEIILAQGRLEELRAYMQEKTPGLPAYKVTALEMAYNIRKQGVEDSNEDTDDEYESHEQKMIIRSKQISKLQNRYLFKIYGKNVPKKARIDLNVELQRKHNYRGAKDLQYNQTPEKGDEIINDLLERINSLDYYSDPNGSQAEFSFDRVS